MRKIIAATNMTIDGICDHTVLHPDAEVHQHYAELLGAADAILYGRITYQLMEFWRTFLEKPSEDETMNDFAKAIDQVPKIVFSRTFKNIDWKSAKLATRSLEEEVLKLRPQPGKNILIGSRSLIIQLMNHNLIDEYQLCIHPVIAGRGLPLFENISSQKIFELTKTKTFGSGAVIHYYKPVQATGTK